ncbi:zinc ribbon domain-containing protein [Nocardia sp. X0981]
MTVVRCQYCGHSATPGAACANCGAPLPDVPAPSGGTPGERPGAAAAHGGLGSHLAEMSGRVGALGARPGEARRHSEGEHPVRYDGAHEGHAPAHMEGHPHHRTRGVLGFLRSHLVDETEEVVHRHHPKWQWRAAAGVAVAVLLVLAFLMVRSCALTPPVLTGPHGLAGPAAGPAVATDALSALPGPLRAASCRPHEETEGVHSCVLAADSPLLMGGITGGRGLAFQVQTADPGPLAQAIAQWRSAGGDVVADGKVFAAVSASSAVWFADTTSGLRVDTGAFASASGARTFLVRSGLLQS